MGRGADNILDKILEQSGLQKSKVEILDIVPLAEDFAVYTNIPGKTGPYGTPLLFRGSEEECRDFILSGRKLVSSEDFS